MKPALEVRQARAGLLIEKAIYDAPAPKGRERAGGGGAPPLELAEAGLESASGNRLGAGRTHRWHEGQ